MGSLKRPAKFKDLLFELASHIEEGRHSSALEVLRTVEYELLVARAAPLGQAQRSPGSRSHAAEGVDVWDELFNEATGVRRRSD